MVIQRIDILSGLWITPETAILLIFFIKISFIPIASNQDIRHPVWRPTHDIADGFVINILATFDDKLIMDMTADETVGEVTHGKAEKISGDCLYDVFREYEKISVNKILL